MAVADLLLDCLELCKSTRMAMDVYHQCQLSDTYGFIAKVSVTLSTLLDVSFLMTNLPSPDGSLFSFNCQNIN